MIMLYQMLDSLTDNEKRALQRDLDRFWSEWWPKLKRSNEQLERWIDEVDKKETRK